MGYRILTDHNPLIIQLNGNCPLVPIFLNTINNKISAIIIGSQIRHLERIQKYELF
ncbi:MAG: hypothetical protein ACN6O7_13485 [Sphingobacterium sp.]